MKKILVLMAMVEDDDDTELLDIIIENKIREINYINKKYNFKISNNQIKNTLVV